MNELHVFPLCYFPPIPWFAAAIHQPEFVLEVSQHYRKQQYTNRMRIRAANRVLPLVIPLIRRGSKTTIGKKQISYQEDWRKQHWKSIESAYRAAPYFEYYEPDLSAFYQSQPDSLLDFHLKTLTWIQKKLALNFTVFCSESYSPSEFYQRDFRESFDPSGQRLPPWFMPLPYPQVFEGFEPGLSILDLMMNEGPNARLLLTQMIENKESFTTQKQDLQN